MYEKCHKEIFNESDENSTWKQYLIHSCLFFYLFCRLYKVSIFLHLYQTQRISNRNYSCFALSVFFVTSYFESHPTKLTLGCLFMAFFGKLSLSFSLTCPYHCNCFVLMVILKWSCHSHFLFTDFILSFIPFLKF